MKIKRYQNSDNLKNEDQFQEDYRFAAALSRYIQELPGETKWFIDECIENEDGTYYAVFRSFRCPEYRKCVLSIKVERNETCSLPWTFSVQKQVTK